jgi:hypothetical protein
MRRARTRSSMNRMDPARGCLKRIGNGTWTKCAGHLAFERALPPLRRNIQTGQHIPANITLEFLPPCSPELNPQENIWDEIREKIFKNYALKSMDKVCDKLEEAALYIERNPKMVKSITSFPYIVRSM